MINNSQHRSSNVILRRILSDDTHTHTHTHTHAYIYIYIEERKCLYNEHISHCLTIISLTIYEALVSHKYANTYEYETILDVDGCLVNWSISRMKSNNVREMESTMRKKRVTSNFFRGNAWLLPALKISSQILCLCLGSNIVTFVAITRKYATILATRQPLPTGFTAEVMKKHALTHMWNVRAYFDCSAQRCVKKKKKGKWKKKEDK